MTLTTANFLPTDGCVTLGADFLADQADRLFAHLLHETRWQQESLEMYGKSIALPRLTAWYGDAGSSYAYSGITMNPHPWTPTLQAIKQQVEAASGTIFNSVLLNLYQDGNHSVSWHSDDEKELGDNPTIASLSLGGSRAFHLKHKRTKETIKLELGSGSLLLMSGETQHHWVHQVPKTKKFVTPRINLTFRTIL
ncbi:MAG TPA: alpha-ketoglutarate-dependent dioxygenase AlkB [Thermosynechococcaceae cyanobacterium]|jgi:alkylated DNA repair dioxygenase AlkB